MTHLDIQLNLAVIYDDAEEFLCLLLEGGLTDPLMFGIPCAGAKVLEQLLCQLWITREHIVLHKYNYLLFPSTSQELVQTQRSPCFHHLQ